MPVEGEAVEAEARSSIGAHSSAAQEADEGAGLILSDLARFLLTATSLDQVLERCLEATIAATALECGGVYLVDRESGAVDLLVSQGLSRAFVEWASRFDAAQPQARLTWAGRPQYVDVPTAPGARDCVTARREGLRALAVVPVIHDGSVLACLNVASRSATEVSSADRDAVETIAAELGSTIVRIRSQEEARTLHEQQVQSQRMEAMRRLAGAVAHDFNNLLTGIIGYADVALEELAEDHPAAVDVEEIRAAGLRAVRLTRELLAFSRRQVVEAHRFQLDELVRQAEPMVGCVVGEAVQVSVDVQGEPWPVLADPVQLDQVLVNLAANAREAMPEGGTLAICVQNADVDAALARRVPGASPGPHVKMTVRDTGNGMSDEVRARVFEPFFSTKPEEHGTGLGLSVVYGIVMQAGGFVDVQSEPGVGTRFEIYLPRALEPSDPATTLASVVCSPRGRETILLAEDEPTVRRLARRVLEGHGYRVLEAADGEAACAVSEAEPGDIDLLLTDVIMPGLDGYRSSERIRAQRPTIRVLFMSGYTGELASQRGLAQEGRRLLSKPFGPRLLLERVRRTLDE